MITFCSIRKKNICGLQNLCLAQITRWRGEFSWEKLRRFFNWKASKMSSGSDQDQRICWCKTCDMWSRKIVKSTSSKKDSQQRKGLQVFKGLSEWVFNMKFICAYCRKNVFRIANFWGFVGFNKFNYSFGFAMKAKDLKQILTMINEHSVFNAFIPVLRCLHKLITQIKHLKSIFHEMNLFEFVNSF